MFCEFPVVFIEGKVFLNLEIAFLGFFLIVWSWSDFSSTIVDDRIREKFTFRAFSEASTWAVYG